MNYEPLMQIALREADRAAQLGEVPVGAVLVRGDGSIVAQNHNRREIDQDPTAHAEMLVIREASQKLGTWRLTGMTLLVTLEPCIMCAGAIILSRLDCVVFSTTDPKSGAVGSLYNILNDDRLNHRVAVLEGLYQEQSRKLLQDFFRERRKS